MDFFVKFPGPGKSWKMSLVLEILVQGPGKTWNFLAMMWEANTMMQVQMPKFAKISSDFICIYENNRWLLCSFLDPVVTAVCLYSCWHMTGSWKNASGVLESPGNFCNQESGNPLYSIYG